LLTLVSTDPPRLPDFLFEAHRMKGTTGTYGFEDISNAIARLEELAGAADTPEQGNSKLMHFMEREMDALVDLVSGTVKLFANQTEAAAQSR
jgi:hypothetical protein